MDSTAIIQQIKDFREENSDLQEIQGATKKELYLTIAAKAPKVISTLFKGLDSDNEITQIKCAQALLNKILPDLKAAEIKNDITQSLQGLIVLAAQTPPQKPKDEVKDAVVIKTETKQDSKEK